MALRLGIIIVILIAANLAAPVAMPFNFDANNKTSYILYWPERMLNNSMAMKNQNGSLPLPQLVFIKTLLEPLQSVDDSNGQLAALMNKFNIRIYGEGVEHKFPPFMERILQRIQTYFSVYKYTDTSQPGHAEIVAIETPLPVAGELSLLAPDPVSIATSDGGVVNVFVATPTDNAPEFIAIPS